MNDTKGIDHGFYPRQVRLWYGIKDQLWQYQRDLVAVPPLPELSEKLSPRLTDLIPALNQAVGDIAYNLSLAANAADAFAEGLTEVGRNYGITEEQAARLAKELDQ